MIFIWIIMYTHRKRNLLEQLGSGTFPAACLFTCTCFCRIPDKVLTARRWIPASQSPLANCSVWLCGFPDWPVFPLKPEQTETMGFDGRISGHVARLRHMVHALAVARCDSHGLPLAFISTIDRGPGGWVSNPLIHDLRKSLKACLLHDIVTQLSLQQRRKEKNTSFCNAVKWKPNISISLTLCMFEYVLWDFKGSVHPPQKTSTVCKASLFE